MKYADFFDPPDGEQTGHEEGENEIEDEDDKCGGDEEMASGEDDDGADDQPVGSVSESEIDSEEEKPVSSFEKKQQKVFICSNYRKDSCISRTPNFHAWFWKKIRSPCDWQELSSLL